MQNVNIARVRLMLRHLRPLQVTKVSFENLCSEKIKSETRRTKYIYRIAITILSSSLALHERNSWRMVQSMLTRQAYYYLFYFTKTKLMKIMVWNKLSKTLRSSWREAEQACSSENSKRRLKVIEIQGLKHKCYNFTKCMWSSSNIFSPFFITVPSKEQSHFAVANLTSEH